MMTKEELITRLVDLLDTVEDSAQDEFNDEEIEDMVLEARIPITRSNGGTSLKSKVHGVML